MLGYAGDDLRAPQGRKKNLKILISVRNIVFVFGKNEYYPYLNLTTSYADTDIVISHLIISESKIKYI